MDKKDILDTIIQAILETNLIFKDIFYKIENDVIYLYLYTKKEHTKQKSTIYYETIDQAITYLQGIRKALYLLEME